MSNQESSKVEKPLEKLEVFQDDDEFEEFQEGNFTNPINFT